MSHFSEVRVEITDEGCLLAALSRLGFAGKVEVHKEAHPLYGYQGDVREQKAHVIIRRQFVGTAANDIALVALERLSLFMDFHLAGES